MGRSGRQALEDAVFRHASTWPQVARCAESLGAHTVADRLDQLRSDGDIVAVTMPALAHEWRARRLKLALHGGHDQVAVALRNGGWRGFEHPIPSVFRLCVAQAEGIVYDIGANTGIYSVIAAATTDQPIYGFEPVPEIAAMARANVELNRASPQVQILDRAASDQTGTAPIYVPAPLGETVETSASLDPDFKGEHEQIVEIATTTLDDHWTSLGRPDVGVIKIDVEGHEVAALAGAEQLVTTTEPVIFIEVLRHTDEIDAFKQRHTYVDVRMSPVEAIFGDEVRFDDSAWNHVLIPLPWVDPLADIATSLGLVTTFLGSDQGVRPT